jgi:hypothetical protein
MENGQKLLENLLRKEHISGFNRSFSAYDFSDSSLIVLSNFHDTERYKKSVLDDLGAYSQKELDIMIKRKIGYTRWEPEYRIRDDKGNLFPDLKIKDKQKYLKLEEIHSATLEEANFSIEYIGSLIGINDAYEIRIQSSSQSTIQDVARMFIEKTNLKSENMWPDPYDVPVVLLLGTESMVDFLPVTMYQQRRRKDSLNFVQRNLIKEIEERMEEDGFEKTHCLANSHFVRRCCNQ